MLDQLGNPNIGHGVISNIEDVLIKAQLSKRLQNVKGYDDRIIKEFKREQYLLYKTIYEVALLYAKEYVNIHEVEGTTSYFEALDFWTSRLTFIMALQYKFISLQVEGQLMNNELHL